MAIDIIMPQMGESVVEGTILRWLVSKGEKVKKDQPIIEISTDKVDTEIPSPSTGVLINILHGIDETVPVGTVLAVLARLSRFAIFLKIFLLDVLHKWL